MLLPLYHVQSGIFECLLCVYIIYMICNYRVAQETVYDRVCSMHALRHWLNLNKISLWTHNLCRANFLGKWKMNNWLFFSFVREDWGKYFAYQKALIRAFYTSFLTTKWPLWIHTIRIQIKKVILNSKSGFKRSFERFLVYKKKSDSGLVWRIQ